MLSDWRLRLRSLFRRARVENELDDELRFHLDHHAEQLIKKGVPPDEARRRARLDLGGVDQIKEDCRDARGVRLVNELGRDALYAWRVLVRRPTASLIIILTLAVGIGANTAVFSVIDSLLLRKLPVADPDRLVSIESGDTVGTPWRTPWTYAVWQQFAQREDLFDSSAAWAPDRLNLGAQGELQYADGLWTSSSFFRTLGVTPMIGRAFTDDDDRAGGGVDGPVAIISFGFWQRTFAGAPDVVGRTLNVEHVPMTIVGVMPPEFFGLEVGVRVDVMVPLGADAAVHVGRSYLTNRDAWWLRIIARLHRDQTAAAATQALASIQPQIVAATLPSEWSREHRDEYLGNFREPLTARPASTGSSSLRDRYARPLVALMIVVGIVLLSACTNVANLLLSRATARRHEMSVRAALGASRWRLVRQLFVETALLAGTGAALGLIVAMRGSRLLVQQVSTPGQPVALDLHLDWRVLAFTAGTALATALLFGTAPALKGTKTDPADVRAVGGRTVVGRERARTAHGLVIAQVALSLVLVVAAVLFGRTLRALTTTPLGFDPSQMLVTTVKSPDNTNTNVIPALTVRIQDAARSIPGVTSAAVSFAAPLTSLLWRQQFDVPDVVPARPPRHAYVNIVSPGWFATYRTPLIAGRDFAVTDQPGSSVAIVNEAFARTFLDGASPIGRTIARHVVDAPSPAWEIVGVVKDTVYLSLRDGTQPTVYVPFGALPLVDLTLSVRAADSKPARLAADVASALRRVDPGLSVTSRPLADAIGGTLTQERLIAWLSGVFGVLALFLAAIGLYGVTSQMISRRRTELGLRLALGATPGSVMRLTLGQASRLVGIGLVLGGATSIWASRFVGTLLYGTSPRDMTTFAASALLLAATAAVAAWLPARAAARIDPADVLRG